MDFSLFLTIVAAAICFVFLRKLRFDQENQETEPSSSLSSSSPSSSSPSPSLSASVSPPTSSSHNWTHDVFPSFSGKDVRRDFLSHIQKEFGRQGITPFIDNEIKRGQSIGREIIRAVRGSKIAFILLSKNYASSEWCLEELVEIMKCREELGQTVMTIFYKVDPSDVEKLTGEFGEVFIKTCGGKRKKDIKRWRQALVKVATIAGYDSNNWDNEAGMIEKIANDVSKKLINSAPSRDFDGLVGMRAHMENMEPFLILDSNEVKMAGIWGPSGIGKSTIARALFSKHSHEFQLSVFMDNIRRRYPRPCYDEYSVKLQLQKVFLSQIINQEDVKIPHLGVAQDRLKDKRVLVVFDDVDHSMQLEAMANETQWFGPGSRIIITTQDKNLLKAHRINHIYEVDFPGNDEALEIFCMYAFGQNSPHDGFERLAWEVTKLAGKLPLGLRVMGSYLKGMPIEEWEEELPRLRTSLDEKMESILEFDALCDEDKDLFLYIACFFNNQQIEKVEEHLAHNFSNVKRGIRTLTEKSLICITSSGGIEMHDLLERLGREIVRKKSIHDPGQRQFLVDARDICKVLNNDTLSRESVIGAIINLSQIEDKINRSDVALEIFSSLEFLRINDDSYNSKKVGLVDYLHHHSRSTSKSLNNLPPKVRLLDWRHLPMTRLPSHFNPELLVELKMQNSELVKLWRGTKTIKNLKWMDLSYSRQLRKLPDLSTATNLRELNLCCCSNLVKLPSSIGNARNLQRLDLSHCSSLIKLPSSIWKAINLQRLDLSHCSRLVELPSFIKNGISLQRLNLSRCSSLVELPSSIENAINLQELYLSGCSSLEELPSSIGNVTSLGELDLSGCSSLVELPSSIGNITMLWSLDLSHCSSLVKLPSSIGNLKLSRLRLQGCSKLEAITININMESLDELDLTDCFLDISANIPETTKEETPSRSRLELRISCWQNLRDLSRAFKYIGELHLRDKRIQEIAPCIKELSRLQKLVIKGCTKLVSLPQLPDSLEIIDAENCESLETLHCSFHNREFHGLNFANCFKLNQEARDLIITKASSCEYAILPGEKVPPHFTYRATGSFLSVKLNGTDTHFPRSLRFKACVLLVNKGNIEVGDWTKVEITHRMKEKQNGVNVTHRSRRYHHQSQLLKEHLYTFPVEERVRSSELAFEFEINDEKWEIGECGILDQID